MGDEENSFQPSKKRAAGRELSRDNPGLDDDEVGTSEQEMGTFKRASDEVLAGRRIVKVRRNQTSSTPSSNPFAGICLVPPVDSSVTAVVITAEAESGKSLAESEAKVDTNKETDEKTNENNTQSESKVDDPEAKSKDKNDSEDGPKKTESTDDKDVQGEKLEDETKYIGKEGDKEAEVQEVENEDKKDDGDGNVEKGGEAASFSSFQHLSSSQNAFTGLSGTGFSSSTFSFGSISKEGSSLDSGSGLLFGLKKDQSSFGFGLNNDGNSFLGSSGASTITKSEGSGFPSKQEVPVETGEENEKAVFTADSVMFEFLDGVWKERGKGELKVNVSTMGTGKARLIMRTRGNYRLILNASLFPDMKLTSMDKKGITFACVNSIGEGKDGLSTFALKFKDASIVEEFRTCVTEHKGKMPVALKTPENSPKASDD